MSVLLPFFIVGIAAGSLYGLAATGLVLTYRTSGVLNFGHGALAAAAAYVSYYLGVDHGVPWPIAVILSVLVLGPLMGLALAKLAASLARVDAVHQCVGTVGIILVVEGIAATWYPPDFRNFPPFLPQKTFQLGGAAVSYSQLIIFVVSVGCVVALTLLLRFTRLGIMMRAVVDSPELVDISGVNPTSVRRVSWIIGSTFAALCGVLIAPTVSLDATVLTFLVVQALGAAALGLFKSLPLTFVGGIVIGIATSLATYYVSGVDWLRGLPASGPFVVLFLVLVLTPRRHLRVLRDAPPKLAVPWRPPVRAQLLTAGIGIVLLALVPLAFQTRMIVWTGALAAVILFLSLGLLVKTSGQVSLCHLGFAGVGAAAFAHLSNSSIPWALALVIAGLAAVPFGLLVAIPAIRLSGVFLALATLGFGVVIQQMFFGQGWLFGNSPAGLVVRRPSLSWVDVNGDTGFFYVALVVAIFASAALIVMTNTRLGRLLRGMSDSPLALATNGANANVIRVLVFCISAFFAGIGGGIMGANLQLVTDQSFTPEASLLLLAILILQPGGVPWYGIFGAIGYTVIPSYINGSTDILNIVFGLSAMYIAVEPALAQRGHGSRRENLAARYQGFLERHFARPLPKHVPADSASVLAQGHRSVDPSHGGISIHDLTVAYGANVVVRDISVHAPAGRVTGLIGPNGAGKTSTFNACSGLVRPRCGRIELDGVDITKLGVAARARRGLGRTYQKIELFDSLTVRENLGLGLESSMAGANPLRHLFGGRPQSLRVAAAIDAAADLCGITGLLALQAGVLSTGQRRLVELARCVAGGYDIFMLDEPSSGLDEAESREFGRIVRSVVEQCGVGVLMVEHDMSLVMTLCDHIYVLDVGEIIFDGSPNQVRASAAVREAYLGAEITVVGASA
jgi:ABC-type branched-subunit amino acid transport system ATPase component/branched-subunit amino acid ABC-type transport system permease component